MKVGIGAAAAVAAGWGGVRVGGAVAAGGGEGIRLSAGEQLFVDDYLVAGAEGVRRVVERAVRLPEPVITAEKEKCFQPYVSVLRDPGSGRFRMWYNVAIDGMTSDIGYIESGDGVVWDRPHRVLERPDGVIAGMGASVVDEGPAFPDASKRYKLAWDNNNVYLAYSPDGIQWRMASREAVLKGNGDIISLSRDPIRGRYVILCKVNSTPEDGYKGKTPNAAEGQRRMVGQAVSDDCVNWSPIRRIIVPDGKDEGITEFYSIGNVIARGGLLLGCLKVLRDDLPAEAGGEVKGIGYTCLAWSRDGERWERDREPFLDRNPTPGTWDRAMTWGDRLLEVGDETFVYYGGYARGHKVERFKERQIGLARVKQDRFVGREAGKEGGVLRTPAVVLDGSGLTVNAKVEGEMRVRVCDGEGRPVEGFDAKDCRAVKGDLVRHEVAWGRPLGALRGKAVRLEFVMREGRVYGFELLV